MESDAIVRRLLDCERTFPQALVAEIRANGADAVVDAIARTNRMTREQAAWSALQAAGMDGADDLVALLKPIAWEAGLTPGERAVLR